MKNIPTAELRARLDFILVCQKAAQDIAADHKAKGKDIDFKNAVEVAWLHAANANDIKQELKRRNA